ncbi:hypothetical protein [Brucella oryzae]|uniref:hypothetical protein n=1 Tax=Brucella oryzae TaxID=335286 RepID=UPI00142DFF65|nr:hypothetical protein [Brucella oryzae]MBR7654428.1 hypothetical protein [Brucella oryzae]
MKRSYFTNEQNIGIRKEYKLGIPMMQAFTNGKLNSAVWMVSGQAVSGGWVVAGSAF